MIEYHAQQTKSKVSKPLGTCNQTGNKAPRGNYSTGDMAAVRVVIHAIVHHMGFTDETIFNDVKVIPADRLFELFVATLPWFPEHDDKFRLAKAAKKGYTGPMQLFSDGGGPKKIHNRVRYLTVIPGRTGARKRARGIGPEHPDNPAAKRRTIIERYYDEIRSRLLNRKTISKLEINQWSKLL